MEAQVWPANEKRDEVGYVRGRISQVVRYPARISKVRQKLKSDILAQRLTDDNSKSPAEPKRSITEQQFKNRMILRRAMLAAGFKPMDSEWWHFTLNDEPFPDTYFTFPVKQLK